MVAYAYPNGRILVHDYRIPTARANTYTGRKRSAIKQNAATLVLEAPHIIGLQEMQRFWTKIDEVMEVSIGESFEAG